MSLSSFSDLGKFTDLVECSEERVSKFTWKVNSKIQWNSYVL